MCVEYIQNGDLDVKMMLQIPTISLDWVNTAEEFGDRIEKFKNGLERTRWICFVMNGKNQGV